MLSKRKEEIKPIVTNKNKIVTDTNTNKIDNGSVAWAYEHFRKSGGEDPPLDNIPLTRTPTPIPSIKDGQKYKH